MTSFLKGLLRNNHSKHKKLLEDWTSAGREETEGAAGCSGSSESDLIEHDIGTSFSVKYLGSTLVETPNGDVATAEAIKAVIALARASGKKLQRVILTVNLRGIKMIDVRTNEVQFDISIYRISYCSADAAYNHVFAFVATNANETMECHAFLCRKRKMAQNAILAIARIFNTAFELWQLSHEAPPPEPTASVGGTKKKTTKGSRAREGEVGKPATKTKGTMTRRKGSKSVERKKSEDSSNLLIDFSNDVEKIPAKLKTWVSFDDDDIYCDRKIATKLTSDKDKNGSWDDSYNSIDLLCLS